MKLEAKYKQWLETAGNPDISERAHQYAEILEPRMTEFIRLLNEAGALHRLDDEVEFEKAFRIFSQGQELSGKAKRVLYDQAMKLKIRLNRVLPMQMMWRLVDKFTRSPS